jgi:molecular chaperone DnaJ
MTDYYKTLGVSKGSSSDEIKKSYKKLAKKFHPDISKEENAEAKFKEISEAYAVLSDEKKKKQYDTFGDQGFHQRYSQEDIFRNSNFGGFEDIFGGGDIFDMFFGGRGRRQQKARDLATDIKITFEESAKGMVKELKLKKYVECKECNGTGAEDGKVETCSTCNGSGQAKRVVRTPFGAIQQLTTCQDCGGQGSKAETSCPECSGQGRKKEAKTLKVNIPAGVDNGSQLRVPGEGEAGVRNTINGDLYVRIRVEPSEIFKREGNDLYLNVPITFSEAALGTEIKIPTLDKEVKVKIKSGTQTGTHYRLGSKGIPFVDGYGKGDLYIIVNVETPKKVSKEQKKIFEKLSKTDKKKSILDRIKDFVSQ